MLKRKKRKLNNNGNTFIVVMVTIMTMSILVAVILATMGYFYRARMVDLKSKNNFYYVEKAMEDIYTGVGSKSTSALILSYEETVSQMVYYDEIAKKYVTMDESKANDMMKQKFLGHLKDNSVFPTDSDALRAVLQGFVTVDGVTVEQTDPDLYLQVVQTQETDVDGNPIGKIRYEKVILHNITVKHITDDGYEQSITTDIEISEPKFTVSFSNVSSTSSSLYDFALISDMGLEFINDTSTTHNVNITGDIYAAADYYNKAYNLEPTTRVNSYADGSEQAENCNGKIGTSKYSGIYAQGVNMTITANKVIVPGTIAVMNDSKLRISGDFSKQNFLSDLWVDNIVLSPALSYTVSDANRKRSDGSLELFANAYVSDDLEINSDNATVDLQGNYYGYNYSQDSDLDRYLSVYANGKAHANSSSILVNGENATLKLGGDHEIYVAGRSYISTTTVRQEETGEKKDAAGNVIEEVTIKYVDEKGNVTEENEDIQTGESIAVRSDQLAYIPYKIGVVGEDGLIYAPSGTVGEQVLPIFSESYGPYNEKVYDEIKKWLADTPYRVDTVNGKTYYFLNFKDADSAREYFKWYADGGMKNVEFYDQTGTDIMDITTYEMFNVQEISYERDGDAATVRTNGTYASGSLGSGNTLKIEGATLSDAPVDLINKAKDYSQTYLSYKYSLNETTTYKDAKEEEKQRSGETGAKVDLSTLTKEEIAAVTPLNYYIDMTKVADGTWNNWENGRKVGDSYVWISKGDLEIKAPDSKSSVTGIIIAMGDVTFADNSIFAPNQAVTQFEGIIISGGKIKCNHDINFYANPELMKTILRTADATRNETDTNKNLSVLCDIFKDFKADDASTSETTSIGNIEVGDILQYTNWKKNVK